MDRARIGSFVNGRFRMERDYGRPLFTNLVTNPSFEYGSTASPWGPNNGPETVARTTARSFSGVASLSCTTTAVSGSGVWNGGTGGLVPGQVHILSAWVYLQSGAAGVQLKFAESSGSSNIYSSTALTTTGVWTRKTLTFTPSAGCTTGNVLLLNAAAQIVVFNLDAVCLTTGATDPGYFDGDSEGAVWTGTPGASTSIQGTPLDLNDGGSLSFIRDSFKITPPQPAQVVSQSDRRYGGGRVVGETHGNGQIEADWYISGGGNADLAIGNAEWLVGALSKPDPGRYLEWRPENASQSVYYELRGPTPGWNPEYRWITWMQQRVLQVHAAVQTAPLGVGDPMDIYDPFSFDTIAAGDYTYDTGSGLTVSGRLIVPPGSSEYTIYHSAKGYKYADAQVTMKIVTGASVAGPYGLGVFQTRLDANNHLLGQVTVQGASTVLQLYKKEGAGVFTQIGSSSSTFTPAANTSYWIRTRLEGNVIYVEWFTSPPGPLSVPATSTSATLTGADAAKLGNGVTGQAGMRLASPPTDYRFGEFTVEPYTYIGSGPGVTPNPQVVHLGGAVPGTAPALADVSLGVTASTNNPIFGLIAWGPTNTLFNRISNGDFEDDVDGWSSSSSSFNNSSSGITRVTTAGKFKFGTAAGEIVAAGGTANIGASYAIYGRPFKRGVTYTVSAWVRAASGTQPVQIGVGSSGTPADVTGATTALSATFQQLTATWTPTADRTDAVFFVRILSTTAQTFTIDGVTVAEGTTLPTAYPQAEGRGGRPPLGPIEGEAFDDSDSVSMTVQSPATMTALSGLVARWTPAAGTTGKASYFLDPSLLMPDTFSGTDLRVEVWARIYYPSTLTRLAIAASIKNSQGVGSERFTGEFGSSGKPIIPAASGSVARLARLGTLVLPADAANPVRWKLSLYFTASSAGTGNLELDNLLLVPARQRASSPTSKPAGSGYPIFLPNSLGTKLIRSNLSGAIQSQPGAAFSQDNGLGGQLLEVNPGANDMLVYVYGTAPDDPTLDTSSDLGAPANKIAWHTAITPRYFLARGN